MREKVSIVKCSDYKSESVERSVRAAIGLIGGISAFIRPKSRVLIKPNLLIAIEPERGITTHPEIIRAVIRQLKEIGAEVFIGDSPSVFAKIEDVKEVHRRTGILKLCEEEGVELVEFKPAGLISGFPLAGILKEVDFVINVPKFKTHDLMVLTGAVKNLFGLIPGLYKSELHKKYFKPEEFAKNLVDIYEAAKPRLNLVDAIDAIEGDGPGTKGDLRHCGLILASSCAAAIDNVLARIIKLDPQDIPTNREAKKRHLAGADKSDIEVVGEKLESAVIPDFKLPQPSVVRKIPAPLFNILKRFLDCRPQIDERLCVKCKKCQEICPMKVIDIDKKKKIAYRNCIRCFCCLEVCPERAISIKKSLLSRLLGMRG